MLKSAIIDAIKMVLQTQSGEYIKVTEDDFYTNSAGDSENEFFIKCVFQEFTVNEAKNFIEWLTFSKNTNSDVEYSLILNFRAWKEKNRIYTEVKAGSREDGIRLDGKAKELLKCTYLRPLRDAARDASLKTSNMKLKAILESLSLSISEIQPGLGTHNLLFIAAELLLQQFTTF